MNNKLKFISYTVGVLSVMGLSNLRAEESSSMIHSDQNDVQSPDSTMVPKSTEGSSLSDAAKQNVDLSTFIRLLNEADLSQELAAHREVTIFAPSNNAFDKLPRGTLEELAKPENKEKLKALLLFHIIPGKYMEADARSGHVKTLNGKEVDIVVKDGKVTVNGANVVAGDIVGQSGVIHVIDQVNQP